MGKHYVPQFLLKNWSVPGPKPGPMIHRYDITGVPQNLKLGRLETSVSDRMTLLQTVQKTGDPSRGP